MFSPDSRLIVLTIRAVMALMTSLACASSAAAQSAIRAVGVSTIGGEAVVTVEGSGPLPTPALGALDGPPRIFLDFANVRLAARGLTRTPDPRVRRVRVGVFSLDPLVTRVVIDLTAVLPHRVELATGRVMLFVGAATAPAMSAPGITPPESTSPPRPPNVGAQNKATAAPTANALPVPPEPRPTSASSRSDNGIPPVPPLPTSRETTRSRNTTAESATATSSNARLPHRPPNPSPPTKDIEKYREQAGTLLERLKLQMPLLEAMQSLDNDLETRMPAAMQEFDRLREELEALRPPESVRTQHELIVQATRLGSTSARLRLEAIQSGDLPLRRNAASAAAGASLLLNRAFEEVGFAQDSR